MKPIKVLGGGISGLSAAINLRKAGCAVEVYEKKDYCGKHTNDFQFLENWTSEEDVLGYLRRINIKTDFYIKPCKSLDMFSPFLKKYTGKSSKPFMYLVKRGKSKDSIDSCLERQAKKAGVKIVYNSNLKPSQADIIAIGPKTFAAIGSGIMFRCNLPDMSAVLFDNNISLKGYSYFIVNDKIGGITNTNFVFVKDLKKRLRKTIEKFEKIYGIRVKNILERFSGGVTYNIIKTAKNKNRLFVGEAAGFQDALAGFGMRYAFKSGFYAAQSIIQKKDYDKLWKKDFLKTYRVSFNNRLLFQQLSNKHLDKLFDLFINRSLLIRILFRTNDFRMILRKSYTTNITKIFRLCFPFLKPDSFHFPKDFADKHNIKIR